MLGVSVRRPGAGHLPSRSTTALRRRLVVGTLVVLALALITVSFRDGEDGPVTAAQDAAASVLRPFEVGVERIARPFRDAWAWFDGLIDAKGEADRLRRANEELTQQVIQNQTAVNQNADLKALLEFKEGPSFPTDYVGLAADVIARPSGAFSRAVVVSVGANDGVEKDAPVVDGAGLVGLVTAVYSRTARVTLLADESSAVSAKDVQSGAGGIVRHGRGVGTTLVLDRVPKEKRVRVGDTVVTAGWRSSRLESIYPKGLPIGRVTSVGQTNTDLYKQIQLEPFADLTSVDAVLVLVPREASLSAVLRVGAIVFVAAILQVTLSSSLLVFGGTADLLLVALIAVALLRGSITGACAGFAGGLLVDVATLGTLGVNALLLSVAGFWAGRYGETTGRDRRHAPLLAVAVITVVVAIAGYLLHFMLGDEVSARNALLTDARPGGGSQPRSGRARVRGMPLAAPARRAAAPGAGGRALCLAPRTVSGGRRRADSCRRIPRCRSPTV